MKKIYILFLLFITFLCGCKKKEYQIADYISNTLYHENYKIMQITDLHYSALDDIDQDLKYLDLLVNEANPDLIIYTGDIFTFATKSMIRYVLDHFDSYQIPWSLTYGNHDEQLYASYEYPAKYCQNLKYCLFKYHEKDRLTGTTNSIIFLNDELGKTIYKLFIVDSNTYSYQNGFGYDYVHEDQINWYKEGIYFKDKSIPSLIFQHIPLKEFTDANSQYEEEFKKEENGLGNPNGILRENACPPFFNSGFFQVIKELESTKALFVGHDHINNYDLSYEGIRFVYGVKSSDNMYHDADMLGYNLITLTSDTINTKFYYHSYEELK